MTVTPSGRAKTKDLDSEWTAKRESRHACLELKQLRLVLQLKRHEGGLRLGCLTRELCG